MTVNSGVGSGSGGGESMVDYIKRLRKQTRKRVYFTDSENFIDPKVFFDFFLILIEFY